MCSPSFKARNRGRLIRLLFCASFVFPAGAAAAGVEIRSPDGWTEGPRASRAALSEADEWATATGLEVTQVASTRDDDGFAENLVVLLDRRPLDARVIAEEELWLRTLAELAGKILDTSGDPVSSRLVDAGESRVLVARWIVEGITWDVALAPSGSEHALVVLKTQRSHASLYDGLFEDVVGQMEGVSAPNEAFPRSAWRWSLVGIWLVLAALTHFIFLGKAAAHRDHLGASRRASVVLAAAAILGATVVYVWLGDASAELQLAETSQASVAIETLVGGVVAVILLSGIGRVLGGGADRVESAPRTGAFSREALMKPPATAPRDARDPRPRELGPEADADLADLHRSSDGD